MRKYEVRSERPERAWTGPNVDVIGDAAIKLRWTDRSFSWHRNETSEVFVVLDGTVDMDVRPAPGMEVTRVELRPGDVLHIAAGEEHVAHPRGEARVLVVEHVSEGR